MYANVDTFPKVTNQLGNCPRTVVLTEKYAVSFSLKRNKCLASMVYQACIISIISLYNYTCKNALVADYDTITCTMWRPWSSSTK